MLHAAYDAGRGKSMELKIFKSGVTMIMAVLFVESFPLPALGQIADDFAADSSLNTSLWTTQSSFLSALAAGSSSLGATLLTPTLSFGSAGMQMTGVNGTYQFAGIQSLAAFTPPLTVSTTVMGTLSYGDAFAVFLVNSNLSQWLDINGDLIPDTCHENVWINYTGSGQPLSNLGNALYGNPSTNVWYTIQISVGTNGNASVALMTNGVTLASQSGLTVGNGSFYIVLAQREGSPCVSGPLAATWQSISVTLATPSNNPPAAPILVSPADGAPDISIPPILNVEVSDPDTNRLTVTFYGQLKSANAGQDFTIVALADTQMYTAQKSGGTISMFTSQTDWIVNNRVASNIVYVTGEGDITDEGDESGYEYEWQNATNAFYRLGDPVRTGLTDGIPFGVVVGNHDMKTDGAPTDVALTWFNKYFGTNYFQGRGYYGGHYGTDNANHYDLFSAGGMNFIALSLEMGAGSNSDIMAWANGVLQSNVNRRAIVTTHSMLNPAPWPTPADWTLEGPEIFNGLTNNPNLFLMMCGHMHGEGRRHEAVGDHYVDVLLADWQDGVPDGTQNGGDGYLRILQFSPSNNQIRVSSCSPYVNQYLTGIDSQFTLDYNMSGMWVPIVTNSNVASGSTTSAAWPGLAPGTQYQWYVTVSDGQATTTGPVWTFTVKTNVLPVFLSVKLTGGMISFDWSAIPGRTYQLQYKTNLAQIDWISLGGTNTATDVTMSATDSIRPDPRRFYRIVLMQ